MDEELQSEAAEGLDDQIHEFPIRGSRWKKLENALRFINSTRRLSKESKIKNFKWEKRSKWVLIRNVFSIVNYFLRISLRKLEIQNLGVADVDGLADDTIVCDEENVEPADAIVFDKKNVLESKLMKSPQSGNRNWMIIRNSLHWIRWVNAGKIITDGIIPGLSEEQPGNQEKNKSSLHLILLRLAVFTAKQTLACRSWKNII